MVDQYVWLISEVSVYTVITLVPQVFSSRGSRLTLALHVVGVPSWALLVQTFLGLGSEG